MWTIERFETALKEGRKIAPFGVRFALKQGDRACALGAILLGAGFEVSSDFDMSSQITRFQNETGFTDDDLSHITAAYDKTGKDSETLKVISNIINHGHKKNAIGYSEYRSDEY